MSVVDLKYAKEATPPADKPQEVVLALAVKGWAWGWAVFTDGQAGTCGFFRIPDHEQGHALAHAKKCVMAFQALFELAERHRFNLLLTETKDKTAAAASLLPVLCALGGSRYLEVGRGWLDELGLNKRELESWATVVLGKHAEDDTVVQALGLGNWWAKHSKRLRGEL